MILQIVFVLLTFLCVVVATSGVVLLVASWSPATGGLPPARVGRYAGRPHGRILWPQFTLGAISIAAGAPLAVFAGWFCLLTSDFAPLSGFALLVLCTVGAIGAVTAASK